MFKKFSNLIYSCLTHKAVTGLEPETLHNPLPPLYEWVRSHWL